MNTFSPQKLLISVIFFAVAAWMGMHGMQQHNEAMASEKWAHVRGTVTDSTVTTHYSRRSTNYRVDLHYTYRVNGTNYIGRAIKLEGDNTYGSYSEAEKVAAHLTPNLSVMVFYDQNNPSDSCLMRGTRSGWFEQQMLLAGIIVIIGLIMPFTPDRRKVSTW